MEQKRSISEVKCYSCNKFGHYSNKCPDKNKINLARMKTRSYIDRREIEVNGKKFSAIFDTGASCNLIHNSLLDDINTKNIHIGNAEFTNCDGSKWKSTSYVQIDFVYENNLYSEKFWIINGEGSDIILSDETVKRLSKKRIPVLCTIDTKDKGPINWTRPIRSYKDKIDFEELVKNLEQRGIIERSTSRWLNPVVLTRKKSGELRFCVDFRRLNDIVDLDCFELPRIHELFVTLRDMMFFSLIDLKDGFFQIEIEPKDREKTTFYTGSKLMQFTKMPQGFKNSPGIFQKVMNLVLEGYIGVICLCYIDDILIFGKNKDEHKRNFDLVKERLESFSLVENKEKRIYEVENIKFLGYEISLNKLKPSVERQQGIESFKTPKNKKELQRFLGMINYDRIFIEKITDKIKPIYKLLEKDQKFIWSDEEQKLFEMIKMEWKKDLELEIPNMSGDFELEADASNVGLGAVLRQNYRPVAYISRALTESRKNYTITEREVLASLWAMEKLKFYLHGKEFVLISDHKPIEELRKKAEFGTPRLSRWLERLARFNFKCRYQEGKKMIVSDALSRAAASDGEGEDKKNDHLTEFSEKELINEILKLHSECNHRKNILPILNSREIVISKNKLRKILNFVKSAAEWTKR